MSGQPHDTASDFRILVVDDELDVLETMAEILESAGWSVEALSSPAEALLKVKRKRYDALVLDLYMPDLPGLLLHSKLKFLDRELWGRTVFVSGHFTSDELRRSLEGTPRFVPKPFRSEALVGTVGMALPEVPRSITGAGGPDRRDGTPGRS